MDEEYIFTCKDCGSNGLRVVWEYKQTFNYTRKLKCFDNCENGHELAAIEECKRFDKLLRLGLVKTTRRM